MCPLGLNCILYNAQSLCNKIHDFIAVLQDSDIDIAAITETWLTAHKNTITSELKVAGYNIMHAFRENKRGGGVAIIHKVGLNLLSVRTHKLVHLKVFLPHYQRNPMADRHG